MAEKIENVIIIVAGPAGLSAALYAGRANLNPLVLTGPTPGGQLALSINIENYPGFPEGVMVPNLRIYLRKAQKNLAQG